MVENGFLSAPKDSMEWKGVAKKFENKWNFHNCVGAIDGKHVMIQAPPREGSRFFNYKKYHSIVLMAVVNANYEFIMVDVGDYGRLSDGSVFANCHLGYAMNNELLNLPPPERLPGTNKEFPYMFVGDEAFPLKEFMMKPYSLASLGPTERIFNYRLSRAHRIVENAFGIATT